MVKLIEGYKYLIRSDRINFSEDTNILRRSLSLIKLELILILEHSSCKDARSLYYSLNHSTSYTKISLINEASRCELENKNITRILEPNNFCYNYLQKLSNDDSLIWIANKVMIRESEYLDKQLKLF